MNTLTLLAALEIGLIYALVAIGVYLSFRLIDFPDLTVDGSFTLGAAVSAALIVTGSNPLLATFIACLAGAMAGMVTGYLHVRWQILGLLASILTMTALYSLNLRIMNKPNIALLNDATIFHGNVLLTLGGLVLICSLALIWLFNTHIGLSIRAVGINPRVSKAYGINVGKMKLATLALSNAMVAFSGALFCQSQGFADISMGTGTIIIGLASVIIGESILGPKKIWIALIACIIGSILYRIAIGLALNTQHLGLQATDVNLLTALLVVLTMILPKLKRGNHHDKA